MTPKESNVYSKLTFHQPYDSFGVERGSDFCNFYKHTIPSGLMQRSYTFIVYH